MNDLQIPIVTYVVFARECLKSKHVMCACMNGFASDARFSLAHRNLVRVVGAMVSAFRLAIILFYNMPVL